MRTNLGWNYDDTDSYNGKCKCALGINHKTGRLQWCPGYSVTKILILLPIIMIPVILMFLLLIRFDHLSGAPPNSDNVFTLNNEIDDGGDMNDESDPRCRAVTLRLAENQEIEERDVLKDIRTSFIPQDYVVIPPNCTSSNYNELAQLVEKSFAQDQEALYLDFLNRHRRSYSGRNTTFDENTTAISPLMSEDIISEVENEEVGPQDPWKAYSDISDTNIPEIKEDIIVIENLRETAVKTDVPAGFHTFWKGEGTPEFIRSNQAKIMLQYMDKSASPCTDFYQYACGNWANLNPIPKDKAGYDTFEVLRESLDIVLRDLLTENIDNNLQLSDNRLEEITESNYFPTYLQRTTQGNMKFSEELKNTVEGVKIRRQIIQKRAIVNYLLKKYKRPKIKKRYKRQLVNNKRHNVDIDAETKAKFLYASCMNSDLLSENGIQPLLNLLQRLGGWPVIDPNWNDENFDWINLTARLRLFNNDIFIVEWVGPDIKNSDENIIQLDQTGLGLPTRDYFLHDSNSKYFEAYKEFMMTIMNQLGATKENAENTSEDVADFEKELAKITSSSEDRANVSILYKRMSVKSLHQIVPGIDWQRYLSLVQERNVMESETIVIYAVEYMQNLVTLLADTEPRTIANYLLWRFVRHRVNNLDDRFQDAKQKFFNTLFGREELPPRWKNCVVQVNFNMGMALGAMFVQRYFDESSKEDTLRMTHELQQAFREILNSTDWLDVTTKHLAELKVNSMSLKIGYPDFILSREELNKKYVGLHIHPDKYFQNTLNILRHVSRSEQRKLNEAVNKTIWQTAPAIVNAYYSRNKNQIMFPAGILQPPFFHRHFPRSLNFGGIGVVIGHELTHGFDDKGRLFDSDGNLHKWWSDYAINGFHERARCLVSQYGNYTVSEVNIAVDGESTQGENIADNGGIRQAFYAYKNWIERNKGTAAVQGETLPGINMTGTQLFFLNFAQVWCGAMRPEATRNKLKTAVHSPGKFRVIGTLSNSVEFAKEFNCPLGSPMNPALKCSVW